MSCRRQELVRLARIAAVRPPRGLPTNREFLRLSTTRFISRSLTLLSIGTGHLPVGASPYWLPYVAVDDVDATIARAGKLGARIPVGPEDIPGIGRFGVLVDPTAAMLAVLKPLPRETAVASAGPPRNVMD
jgi:hypothetical protein